MRGQPCPCCSGLDGRVGTGPTAPSRPALLSLEGSSPKVHPGEAHHFPAAWGCFPWGNPNKYPWRPEPGDGQHTQPCPLALPNSQDSLATAHSQPGCGAIPSLDMVSFPTSLWLRSQTVVAFPAWPWLHSQPGHAFIPHLAVAAQEAPPRLTAPKHPPSLAVRCAWAVRSSDTAQSMQDPAKPRAHPRATQSSIPNPAWSQSAPTTALSHVLT